MPAAATTRPGCSPTPRTAVWIPYGFATCCSPTCTGHAGGLAGLHAAAEAGRVGPFRTLASAEEARPLARGTHIELGLDLFGLEDRSVFPPASVDSVLSDGQELAIGDVRLRVIVVPATAPAAPASSARSTGRRVLFAGDLVFTSGSIGAGTWPGSSHAAYRTALPKLAGLNVDALLPGNGVWTLRGGQQHIDRGLEDFHGLWPPPNLHGPR